MIDLHTAIILIGFQNDYFAPEGILHSVIEESSRVTNTLHNTVDLLHHLVNTQVLFISTPIFFTQDYEELVEPVGILKVIKEKKAFQAQQSGSATIEDLKVLGDRILEVPGKRGLNAFASTDLHQILQNQGITDVVLAGTVTSICIDSTGRSAHELGYRVTVLSDCTSARTVFEQEFYCENIFPLYAQVLTSKELLQALSLEEAA